MLLFLKWHIRSVCMTLFRAQSESTATQMVVLCWLEMENEREGSTTEHHHKPCGAGPLVDENNNSNAKTMGERRGEESCWCWLEDKIHMQAEIEWNLG